MGQGQDPHPHAQEPPERPLKRRFGAILTCVLLLALGAAVGAGLVVDQHYRDKLTNVRDDYNAALGEARVATGPINDLHGWHASRAPESNGSTAWWALTARWDGITHRLVYFSPSYERTMRECVSGKAAPADAEELAAMNSTDALVAELRQMLQYKHLIATPDLTQHDMRPIWLWTAVPTTLTYRAAVHVLQGDWQSAEAELTLLLELANRMHRTFNVFLVAASPLLACHALDGLCEIAQSRPLGTDTMAAIAASRCYTEEELRFAATGSLAFWATRCEQTAAGDGAGQDWWQGSVFAWAEENDFDNLRGEYENIGRDSRESSAAIRGLIAWLQRPALLMRDAPDFYASALLVSTKRAHALSHLRQGYAQQLLAAAAIRAQEAEGAPLHRCTRPAGQFPFVKLDAQPGQLIIALAPSFHEAVAADGAELDPDRTTPLVLVPVK